jgi:trigger factor
MPQVEELGDNRVRLTVDVTPHQLEHAVEHAAADLAETVKIPGFRKGKVPMPVLLSRIGKDRLWAEAIDSHIGGWFWSAASRTRLRPITTPAYDYAPPASEHDPWSFTATVEVQPIPEIVDWTTLEVPRPDAEAPEELVQQELDALRRSVAELVAVDRPAQEGDTVVVDLMSPNGESQSDTVVELGSGRLVEEIENAIVGGKPGESAEVSYELADGSAARVTVTLKHVNEQVLPEIDDELARSASEFDTLAELRADVENRIKTAVDAEIEERFRQMAVEALIRASEIRGAGPLVETRARDLLNGFVRSLASRGIEPNQYFQITGQTPEQLTMQVRLEAALSVARELALEAVAVKAGIEATDDDVKALIRERADAAGQNADELIEDIWAHGEEESLREDLRLSLALDKLASEVKRVSVEAAEAVEARAAIWTPDSDSEEKEKGAPEKKLWTPGSKEDA